MLEPPARVELARPGLGNLAPKSVGGDKYVVSDQLRPSRINKIEYWHTCDSSEQYHSVGIKMVPIPYAPNSFTYNFNEEGFRCDSFKLPTDLPIVFLGCSITEGVGLPLEETWSYKILEKIRNITNKNIPYWSLALGGTGIDCQVRLLYEFVHKRPIKHIFCLFPAGGRREYCLDSPTIRQWLPRETPVFPAHVTKLFSDPYYTAHQDNRSLMLLAAISKLQAAPIVISQWGKQNSLPIDFPSSIDCSLDRARDAMHPGPIAHTDFSNVFWEHIKHLF